MHPSLKNVFKLGIISQSCPPTQGKFDSDSTRTQVHLDKQKKKFNIQPMFLKIS